jgi:hypothetical protein
MRWRLPIDQSGVDKVQAARSAPNEACDRPRAARRRRKSAMSGRPKPVGVVAEFLRKALGSGPVVVSDLEAMAHAAGLLADGQLITHAKLFKQAKKSLGIRSVRSGFGSGGEWHWLLEKHPAPPVTASSSVVVSRVPSSWIEGVARLEDLRPPTDIPAHRLSAHAFHGA